MSSNLLSKFLLLLLLGVARAEDWPQWGRTDSRNMISHEHGLPDSFVPGKLAANGEIDLVSAKNIKWVARLGSESYGNVTVAGGRVCIGTNGPTPYDPKYTAAGGGVLLCLDESSGKFLWQMVLPKLKPLNPKFTCDQWSVGVCSSPTVVGSSVYVTSNRGEVLALDPAGLTNGNDGPFAEESEYIAGPEAAPQILAATDGDIRWRYDMIKELGSWPHDASNCSVLVHGDFLYAGTSNGTDSSHRNIPAPEAPSLIVLNRNTGRLVAVDGAGISPHVLNGQWSSPSLATVGTRTLVFYGGGDGYCYAFEALSQLPVDGEVRPLKKVWWCDCNPTEFRVQDTKNNALGSRRRLQSEIISTPVCQDGRVYVAIGQDPHHGLGKGCLTCIDATGDGDITASGKVWSYTQIGRCVSTAAIADGLLYIGDTSGVFHCLDARTGTCQWTHEAKGEIWGSALVADGKVYFGDMSGCFTVLSAGREKRILSEIKLSAPICSTPIAANGVLYLANHTHLYAIWDHE